MCAALSREHALALTCNKAAPSNPREIHLHGEKGGQRDLLPRGEREAGRPRYFANAKRGFVPCHIYGPTTRIFLVFFFLLLRFLNAAFYYSRVNALTCTLSLPDTCIPFFYPSLIRKTGAGVTFSILCIHMHIYAAIAKSRSLIAVRFPREKPR